SPTRRSSDLSRRHGASWAIWTYKDIGLQGVVYAKAESPWIARVRPILEKKARLGVDAWGARDTGVRHILEPIERTFAEEFPNYNPFPFGVKRHIDQLVRHVLLAEPLVEEFAELFGDVTAEEIDTLMRSFRFENCARRDRLAEILRKHA